VERVGEIRTSIQQGGKRAPHKPLLLLQSLGRVQQGKPRPVSYTEIEKPLRSLLQEFGPSRKTYHPEYPFTFLISDGLWELDGAEDIEERANGRGYSASDLKAVDVRGGLPAVTHRLLASDPALLSQVTHQILDLHFPASIQQDVLEATSLDPNHGEAKTPRPPRDPDFRPTVLRAYEYRCAICGYDGRLGTKSVALDAAPVRSASAPSTTALSTAESSASTRAAGSWWPRSSSAETQPPS
jgi:putative restriction endonuclease